MYAWPHDFPLRNLHKINNKKNFNEMFQAFFMVWCSADTWLTSVKKPMSAGCGVSRFSTGCARTFGINSFYYELSKSNEAILLNFFSSSTRCKLSNDINIAIHFLKIWSLKLLSKSVRLKLKKIWNFQETPQSADIGFFHWYNSQVSGQHHTMENGWNISLNFFLDFYANSKVENHGVKRTL